MFPTEKIIINGYTSIDNAYGASINIGNEGPGLETVIQNSHFYGEAINRDCPVRNGCTNNKALSGNCLDKKGIQMTQFVKKSKEILPSSESSLPHHKPKGSGSWWGKSYIRDSTFEGFTSGTTYCGKKQ